MDGMDMGDLTPEEFSDLELFEVPGPVELSIPPDLHAMPASALEPLAHGELVTIAHKPGTWWLDAFQVINGPHPAGAGRDEESYFVSPWAEYTARAMRPGQQPEGAFYYREIPTSRLWVYRPGAPGRTIDDLPAWRASAWLERIQDGAALPASPPSPRRPRPATEMPSLVGQRVYGPALVAGSDELTNRRWQWWIAVSEPISEEGGIWVRCMLPAHYYAGLAGTEVVNWKGIPAHRLYVY